MLTENIWAEYWLVQCNGEGKFGPFTELETAYECIVEEKLGDYELKTVLSYIPF
jgi:hypothetical protein